MTIGSRFVAPLALLGGIALTLATQVAFGQNDVASGLNQPDGPAQRLDAAVRQLGIRTCAPVFSQAGRFLFEGGRVQFVVQPLGPDVNRWPTAVTAESSHASPNQRSVEQTRFTTLIIAPAGSCSGLYQQVIYWPQPCASLKAHTFAGFSGERPLLARVRQSEAGPGLQLYLMPAGAGCVSIKKELIG